MTVIEIPDEVRLDVRRGGWMGDAGVSEWEMLTHSPLAAQLDKPDAAVVFGGGGGGAAAYIRQQGVAHMFVVESDPAVMRLLDMSWESARGVSLLERDPVRSITEVVELYVPSVVVLNLRGRECEPATVMALTQPLESVEVLCIIWGAPHSDRAGGIDDLLPIWHEGELAWERCESDVLNPTVYCR